MPPIIYVLVFLAAFLAVEGLATLWNESRGGSRAAARRRLRELALGVRDPSLESEVSILRARAAAGRTWAALAGLLPGTRELERRLYQAGWRIGTGAFLALSAAIGAGAWLLGTIALGSPTRALPFALAAAIPMLRARQRRLARLREFEEQFPEALDLITRALRAGHSLLFGFQMVGEEMADPIGAEFGQVAEEIKLGQDLRVALGNLVYRVEAGDLPFFVTAVTIQRETGGNLAEVLEKLGYLIRERFALYGKVRALTAVGKASANLLALMPVLMILMLYTCGGSGGQSYVRPLFATLPGQLMAATAGVLVLIGYLLSIRLARIEV
jgi:tight adherence protein B